MNNKIKHQQMTGQMKRQKPEPKTNASVFLFFPTAYLVN